MLLGDGVGEGAACCIDPSSPDLGVTQALWGLGETGWGWVRMGMEGEGDGRNYAGGGGGVGRHGSEVLLQDTTHLTQN